MINIFRVVLIVTLGLTSGSAISESINSDSSSLCKDGISDYQQHKYRDATSKLKQAASKGCAEAAYYLGELERLSHTFMTQKSEQWYRQAAAGGDVYAMVRLADADICAGLGDCDIDKDEWFQKALDIALPKAKSGDVAAMDALYSVYGKMGDEDNAWYWLKKAAEHGNASSQYWVSHLIKNGYSFYWTDDGRMEDAIKWMRQSAEAGFPKAMVDLSYLYKDQDNLEKARYWVEQAGKTDYYVGIFNYGYSLYFGSEGMYKFSDDRKVEGFATIIALYRETNDNSLKGMLQRGREKLSADFLDAAEARAKDLLTDKPILYYDPKFGL
ncbi:sel1 repeat family protein [Marinobacter sp. R17]|uniref:tetratricopeptide repeat protein n=1 Tax=Marinobacter sp. R17 TaxID=2484250 RepID=UPI000F4B7A10|nr:tetratricopeptide repeat protein [Marinobacter sp. R17]ROT99741.1 sel1 repeat family protein [Marinobacter sp. R17]